MGGGGLTRRGWDSAEVVCEHDLVSHEGVVADDDGGIGGNDGADQRAVIANQDQPVRADVEVATGVDAAVMPDAQSAGTRAAIVRERKAAVAPAALANDDIVGQRGR